MTIEECEYWQDWIDNQMAEKYGVFIHFSFMQPKAFFYINLN